MLQVEQLAEDLVKRKHVKSMVYPLMSLMQILKGCCLIRPGNIQS